HRAVERWGVSSAGRALRWHCRGQRFDPVTLHHLSNFTISAQLHDYPAGAGCWIDWFAGGWLTTCGSTRLRHVPMLVATTKITTAVTTTISANASVRLLSTGDSLASFN